MGNDELVLYYQPKICLLRGDVIGAEALVRWADGTHEIIPPNEFLPLVESSGLLHDLTMRLLDQVADAAVELRGHASDLALSMNVAPNDLASNNISNRIGELLAQETISPEDLQIEITESAVMGNVERVRDDLERLNRLGIKVLMDDFGTGYSSIDRLSQLPFDALKLDQGVVKRMGSSRQSLDVVRSAISMARELGMKSVAEGIETEGVYNFLIANGCEEAQGYYIARPMSLADLIGFVSETHDFEGSQIGRVHQATMNLMHFRKSLVDAAYCSQLGVGVALESVIDPGLCTDVKQSRMGEWYFGIGKKLEKFETYSAIEKPLYDMHLAGQQFIQLLSSDVGAAKLKAGMHEVDKQFDRLVTLLHALERDLVSEKLH